MICHYKTLRGKTDSVLRFLAFFHRQGASAGASFYIKFLTILIAFTVNKLVLVPALSSLCRFFQAVVFKTRKSDG